MIELNNTTVSIQDANGILSAQSVAPFELSIANKYTLIIAYEFNQALDGNSFWFVPGLFLPSDSVFAYKPTKPTAFYSFQVKNTDAGVYLNASYSGPSTENNIGLQWQISADRQILTVKLSFYAISDIKDWLRNTGYSNNLKLLNSSIDNPIQIQNNSDSVYSNIKHIGAYLYTEFVEDENIHNYESDGVTLTITRNDGRSFRLEGLSNGLTNVNVYIRKGPFFLDIAIGSTITAISHSQVSFTGGTIIPAISNDCAYFNITDGIDIYSVGNMSYQGNVNAKYAFNTFAQVNGLFYDEGFANSPAYHIERASMTVYDLSAEINTLFTTSVSASTAPTHAQFLLIRVDDLSSASDIVNDYELREYAGTTPTLNGSVYESSFSIPYTSVEIGARYRVITLFFDTTGNQSSSHISSEITVKSIPETLAIPDIVGKITNYIAENITDFAQEASVYERLELTIVLDKASYNASNVQGGGFDQNINSITVSFDNETVTAQKVAGNWVTISPLNVNDLASSVEASLSIRVKRAWEGNTIEFIWTIGFATEPSTLKYKQKVAVRAMENNTTPDTLTSIVLKDPDTGAQINDFYLYSKAYVKVEVQAVSNYADVAAILDSGGIFEENLASKALQSLDSANIEGLTQLSPTGSFLAKFSQLASNGAVAMLAFRGYELVLTTDASDIELFFGGSAGLEVTMSVSGLPDVTATTYTWWNYSFGNSEMRTLRFSINDVSLLTDLRISRQNGLGNAFIGEIDLSKLTSLTSLEAQNNQFNSVVFATFVQQPAILVELFNNALDVNEALQNLAEANEGASNANRILSLYGNTTPDQETIPLVQALQGLGFNIELAYFYINIS